MASFLSSAISSSTLTLPSSRSFSVMASAAVNAPTKVVPAVIVGGGRVGRALQDMGSGNDVLVKRGNPVPSILKAPSWSALGTTISIKFLKLLLGPDGANGMLEPWFESKGLNDAGQVLAYFAVSKLGEAPIDGKTDTNPEGLTAAYGKWASAVAGRLLAGGLSCKVLEKEAFQKQMLEKLIWICSFMLVGTRNGGVSVGAVEKEFTSDVSKLIEELASAAAAEKGLTFEEGMVERLCAYSRAVAHFPTAVKEFKWRNGWFYSISEKAMAQGKPDPCPLHTQWLKELKVV